MRRLFFEPKFLQGLRFENTVFVKPFVLIDGDLNDLRLYSEEQTRTNIEAFVEQLAQV